MKLAANRLLITTAAATGLALATVPTAALAQHTGQSRMELTRPNSGAPKFSDKQLKTYAKAADDVRRISKAYMPRMKKARNSKETSLIRKQAEDKMVDAINKRGLSVQKYNRITVALRHNPQLASRVRKMMADQATETQR